MELMTGLEPVTSALPRQCTTNCATLANNNFASSYHILHTFTVGPFGLFRRNIKFLTLWLKTCHRQLFFTRRANCATLANNQKLCTIIINLLFFINKY